MTDMAVVVRLIAEATGSRGPFGLDWLSDDLIRTVGALATLVGASVAVLQWITGGLRTDLKDTREELNRTRADLHVCQQDLAAEQREVRRLNGEVDRLTRLERDHAEAEGRLRRRIELLEEQGEMLNAQLTSLIRDRGQDIERRRADLGPPGGVERRRSRVVPDEGIGGERDD